MSKDLEVCILISACIHCLLAQTFPYVSFKGHTLANHSYVDLSLVGNGGRGSDSVQCHTDLSTCCRRTDGPHRGDWYFPNGTRLSFAGGSDTYEVRISKGVDLRRRANKKNGIYRCGIPTVRHATGDTVYVGLYLNGGEQW